MVIKRIKSNACGAKVNLKLLEQAGKVGENKNKHNTNPPKRGEGSK